jgi:predicted DNA-binding WGR domain protein
MMTIESAYSLHEGGTKFYQAFKITNNRQLAIGSARMATVCVTHWGKYHPGAITHPGAHGQCKVQLLRTNAEASSAFSVMVSNKSTRGYAEWDIKKREFKDEKEFRDEMAGLFNGRAPEMLTHLLSTMLADPDFHPPVAAPRAAPRTRPAPVIMPEEPIDRGPEWASW